jgi:alpha-1,3-rhamnosyl/mannosyltransferase
MQVVFNNLATFRAKTGVGHYATRLAEALSRQLAPGELTVFPSPFVTRFVPTSASRRIGSTVSLGQRIAFDTAKTLGRHAVGSWFYAAHSPARFDVYHEPNFLPLPSRLPTVITVHDLSVMLHPEWHPLDRVRRHQRDFVRAITDATRIITVSETVRREIIAHFHVESGKTHAVPNGVGPEFFASPGATVVRNRLGLPERYLLYIGTIEPRKNVLTLLRAWCDLPAKAREYCPLIMAGGWGWKSENVADYYRAMARHHHVRHIGYVCDEDRAGLLTGARALFFPSHYEGFGLPPLEMLATGGAVVASTAAAHREVLTNHAHFVDANDLSGWREALLRAATQDDWLDHVRVAARDHAKQFTWDRTAWMTMSVYQNVIQKRMAA